MGYILVQPEVLRAKGINYFETIPDGRAIAEMRMLKILGSLSQVDVVSSAIELKKLIADQIAAGITPPVPEDETLAGDIGYSPEVSGEELLAQEDDTNEVPDKGVESDANDVLIENMEEMTNGNE